MPGVALFRIKYEKKNLREPHQARKASIINIEILKIIYEHHLL